MTSPELDEGESSPGDGAAIGSPDRRRALAIAGALIVLLLAGAIVAGIAVSRSLASTPAAAPVAITTSSTVPPPSVASSTPATVSSSVAAPPPALPGKKVAPPAMSAEQGDRTRSELTALAARLPAHLALTAPATWAQWAGQTPSYTDDIVSCPHIAARLDADLGERWTYTHGKLPQGPFGCYWTPVPWVPDVSRFFVSIGYQTGSIPDLLNGMDYCAGGVEAPRIDVPAVGRGALLYGCDDDTGPGYDLAVPDTGGSGVFFLHATGGAHDSPARVADAVLAVIDGATRAYG